MEPHILEEREDETIYISSEGLQKLMSNYRPHHEGEGVSWTADYLTELPIRMKKYGPGSEKPTTLIEEFRNIVQLHGDWPALSKKVSGKWITINYREYFEECITFGRSLIELGCHLAAVNIIGFNSPEWVISFFGSLFARCFPVGIYTTNNAASCQYISDHSECALVVAQNHIQVQKYIPLLKKGAIKAIVIIAESSINYNTMEGRIMLWKDFMALGKRVEKSTIEEKMSQVKPGNCCTLVYTSGTTGMPKGVMLSHDNYTWTFKAASLRRLKHIEKDITQMRIVSYLPLSHAAAQIQDVTGSMMEGAHVYFTDEGALTGTTLSDYLREIRPTIFFSVPRVWEKIAERLREIARTNGWLVTKIANWAKEEGQQGYINAAQNKATSFSYKVAKFLVFDNIRKAIGLDQALYLIFGAAPLAPEVREYFASLGMPLVNGYGMSECSGPQSMTDPSTLKFNREFMREAGTALPGTEMKIVPQAPGDSDGEICYRGRNVFMGYYKNPAETAKTIDKNGFLHSGDSGMIDAEGVLFITGRLKELLITAAGENVPPLLIEETIKAELPLISNVMAIGDNRKYLTALVTLKSEPDGKIPANLLIHFEKYGSKSKTVEQAKSDPIVFKIVMEGIGRYNEKAISRAQRIQTVTILGEDFTTDNGLLTPTLKLKRKEVLKRYEAVIESMYTEPKL